MTTQQHIDGLITTIWNATENRSVTNVMVARVLDWLNRRSLQLQLDIEAGHQECVKEFERVDKAIKELTDTVKGVNTLAGSAYGRADTNARAIDQLGGQVYSILYFIEHGVWPEGWEGGNLGIYSVIDRDRGAWKAGEFYFNGIPDQCGGVLERSHVWYFGCKFRCRVTGTTEPPRWDSPDWEFEEGNPDLTLQWTGSENKVYVHDPKLSLEVAAFLYNQELTESPRLRWDWTRESWHDGSQDSASDRIWNAAHRNTGSNSQQLAIGDMNYHFGKRPDRLTYIVTATLLDEAGTTMNDMAGLPIMNQMAFTI